MNKVIIHAEDREGSVLPIAGDVVETDIGSSYYKITNGYVNLADGVYLSNEHFVGKIKRVIRGALFEITEYGYGNINKM